MLRCTRCHSLTTAVAMERDAAERFYSQSYYKGGDYADYESSEAALKSNFRRFAKRLSSVQPGGRLLEVGCAYGYFLDVARESWEVDGIDVSAEAIAACKPRFGERVHCGDLLAHSFQHGAFSCIACWDTIEHVDQPRAYLRRFADLLAPRGSVALTTGDISSLVARTSGRHWRLLTPPSHLTFFSRPGMHAVLEDAGFEDIHISSAGYSRSLEFVLFRMLGQKNYKRLVDVMPALQGVLRSADLYVNLFDIMFVTARKAH